MRSDLLFTDPPIPQWSELMGTAMRDADEDAERYLRGEQESNPQSAELVHAQEPGGCKEQS